MINLYLGSDKQAQITALAKNPESSLRGYVYEALRELTRFNFHVRSLNVNLVFQELTHPLKVSTVCYAKPFTHQTAI